MQSIHLETSSACKAYTWKPAVHAKYTPGNQQCMQSIRLETSSAFKVYAWKPAVHSKYTAGNQQCMQSIRLETSSACKVYAWKSAVHAKYTPGNYSSACKVYAWKPAVQKRTAAQNQLCVSATLQITTYLLQAGVSSQPLIQFYSSIHQLNGVRSGWFILRLNFGFDVDGMHMFSVFA